MVLKNAKHELFAQGVAAGEAASLVYGRIYPRAAAASCEANAFKVLKRSEVRERVREIQGRAATRAVLTLARKRALLNEIAEGRLPMRTVRKGKDLIQEIYEPMKAIELDARLAGELNPQAEPNGMEEILEKLFAGTEEGGLP